MAVQPVILMTRAIWRSVDVQLRSYIWLHCPASTILGEITAMKSMSNGSVNSAKNWSADPELKAEFEEIFIPAALDHRVNTLRGGRTEPFAFSHRCELDDEEIYLLDIVSSLMPHTFIVITCHLRYRSTPMLWNIVSSRLVILHYWPGKLLETCNRGPSPKTIHTRALSTVEY